MRFIRVTGEYGLVVRSDALAKRGVSLSELLAVIKVAAPLDFDDHLISFGPSFGQEALDALVKELSGLGFRYFEDFFEFVGDFPSWCSFGVSYVSEEDAAAR